MILGCFRKEVLQMLENLSEESIRLADEFCEKAKIKKGQLVVMGCSSSEIRGSKIGSDSSLEVAEIVFGEIYRILSEKGAYIAVQCCEHLNRALIVEREALKNNEEVVNAVPQLHAGGAFAMTAYKTFKDPVAVEHIKADAGIDIGSTLIGMHLKEVAVPVRVSQKYIGSAYVVCARTRPKYIGGERARYDERLM